MAKIELNKEFWNCYQNQTRYTEFEVAMVARVLNGEGLAFDAQKLFALLFNMAITNGLSQGELNTQVKKLSQSIPNFLQQWSELLQQAKDTHHQVYKMVADREKRRATLPEFGNVDDSDEVLAFIKKLDKDLYNFSEAEKLVAVTRQTLKKYADNGLHGLTMARRGKSEYLTKESVARFYRTKWEAENGTEFEMLLGLR